MPFLASKFKNTTPRTPKKEDCISDLPIGSVSCNNDAIRANGSFLSFYIDGEGGKLGILPVDARGRKQRQDLHVICAHSEAVSDFAFAPFEENRLITCSRDDKVKLWKLGGEESYGSSVSNPDSSFSLEEGQLAETIIPHTTAKNLIAVASGTGAGVYDIETGSRAFGVDGMGERVLSGSWHGDGTSLVLADKNRGVGVFDPRQGSSPTSLMETHLGLGREIRVLYLGSTGKILTSGFSKTRYREIFLYDQRNATTPYHTQQFDTSTGILIPMYDRDTDLLYLAGKGSNKITLCEIREKNPFIGDVYSYGGGNEQTLGACIVPKTALDVMSGEVGKIMQLTKSTIYPISCTVPRKTYRDFIPDLFPPTRALVPGSDAKAWTEGSKDLPPVFSLDPGKKADLNVNPYVPSANSSSSSSSSAFKFNSNSTTPSQPSADLAPKRLHPIADAVTSSANTEKRSLLTSDRQPKSDTQDQPIVPKPTTTILSERTEEKENAAPIGVEVSDKVSGKSRGSSEKPPILSPKPLTPPPASETEAGRPTVSVRARKNDLEINGNTPDPSGVKFRGTNRHTIVNGESPLVTPKRTPFRPTSIIGPTSKFRHVVATPGLKDTTFTNLRKVNTRIPLESNGFCASKRWAAVPIAGPGGVISILELRKPGKLPDGVIPGIENHSAVTDMTWCPFDESQLAVGCENGTLKIWNVPQEGVDQLLDQPSREIDAHEGKVICVRYNPVYKDVLVTAGGDHDVVFWDLHPSAPLKKLILQDHDALMLSMAWSHDGQRLATAAKDGFIRIYEPQASAAPVMKMKLLESTRGARLIFACSDSVLALVSFSKGSDRQITMYNSETLELIHSHIFDPSPQLLIPYYDYDSSVLSLTAKGDRMIRMFEMVREAPFLLTLATHTSATPHQAISFLHKNACDVKKVEFAQAYRLTQNTVEPLSFTVPRVKKDLFQNDLFPESLVQWEAQGSSDDWYNGTVKPPLFRSLRPSDMENLYPEPGKNGGGAKQNDNAITARPTNGPGTISGLKSSPVKKSPATIMEEESKAVDKQGLMASMGSKMEGVEDGRGLEQEDMEGVAEEEWAEEV